MPTPASVVTDKRVAVMVADGLEEVECLAVVDVLSFTTTLTAAVERGIAVATQGLPGSKGQD